MTRSVEDFSAKNTERNSQLNLLVTIEQHSIVKYCEKMDHVLQEGANQSSEKLIRKNKDICQILKELSQGEVSFLLKKK